jgi:hypothetical protein
MKIETYLLEKRWVRLLSSHLRHGNGKRRLMRLALTYREVENQVKWESKWEAIEADFARKGYGGNQLRVVWWFQE